VSEVLVGSPDSADLDRARRGDEGAFARLVAPLRGELYAHCYRMLGSTHDADDALQDALLRAWHKLASFEGRGSLRAWIYSVATRVCLDAVERRGRRALPVDLGPASDAAVVTDAPRTDVSWLEPFPDAALGNISSVPDARYEQREAVELAFVAALQHLPGNQRAALLLVEVLGFAPVEVATMMATSIASVNSALQRARRLVAERVPAQTQQRALRTMGDARLQEIVAGYANALERGDADALVALLTEDVTDFAIRVPITGCGRWRHVPTVANGQPAVAGYRSTDASGTYRCWSINVLDVRDGLVAGITSFIGPEHFVRFGLPDTLPA